MAHRDYQAFLESKAVTTPNTGIEVEPSAMNPMLFGFQRDLVRWSLRKGRSALFATTGMGKTAMQCEWARLLDVPTLILAPLAVAQQTEHEAAKFGITARYRRHQKSIGDEKIVITNYELLDHFDASRFQAVVLDESSIIKNHEAKTRAKLIETFRQTPYRLCCTATPAPNDIAEIANHAEFLGICTRTEMLATYFVHDDDGWRLKGHAVKAFYKWLASWSMAIQKPSDICPCSCHRRDRA